MNEDYSTTKLSYDDKERFIEFINMSSKRHIEYTFEMTEDDLLDFPMYIITFKDLTRNESNLCWEFDWEMKQKEGEIVESIDLYTSMIDLHKKDGYKPYMILYKLINNCTCGPSEYCVSSIIYCRDIHHANSLFSALETSYDIDFF